MTTWLFVLFGFGVLVIGAGIAAVWSLDARRAQGVATDPERLDPASDVPADQPAAGERSDRRDRT